MKLCVCFKAQVKIELHNQACSLRQTDLGLRQCFNVASSDNAATCKTLVTSKTTKKMFAPHFQRGVSAQYLAVMRQLSVLR